MTNDERGSLVRTLAESFKTSQVPNPRCHIRWLSDLHIVTCRRGIHNHLALRDPPTQCSRRTNGAYGIYMLESSAMTNPVCVCDERGSLVRTLVGAVPLSHQGHDRDAPSIHVLRFCKC